MADVMWIGASRRGLPDLPLFDERIIIGYTKKMRLRILLVALLWTASVCWAGIVDNVRLALGQNNFSAAEAQLEAYRGQRGVDAEYLEAYSWMARAALDQQQYDQAAAYAKQTKAEAVALLKQRPLDAEPHLPIA